MEALTGPLARGDRETLQRQLDALPPQLAEVYLAVISLVSHWDGIDWTHAPASPRPEGAAR
ncbi:MAG TPA: DUF2520 domain-containing protein [Acidobacteria bacterium]|nr:DUF2520 domain-containing protein [Acidobacteriota bacterium]